MKKIINITIGGMMFSLEDSAYTTLSQYLEEIKRRLVNEEDVSEVMDDIERSIAEKLLVRTQNERMPVTDEDIAYVITDMGDPSDFSSDVRTTYTTTIKKRLYRAEDDMVIAGVASGLGHYLHIEPVIVRLLFFLSIFFGGLGVLVYVILWFVIPIAKTSSEKEVMQMGYVPFHTISEQVKEKARMIRNSIK